MYNFKNKNLYSDDILNPNKNNNYYYDFGTGKQFEREEVKEKREAFLNAASGSSTNLQKQKEDDFLEGFNDPYGEKREQERQQKEQERKEKFANIRANADKRTLASQSTTPMFPNTELYAKAEDATPKFPNTQLHTSTNNDAFLEGFNNPNGDKKTAGEVLKDFASETVQDIGAHIGLHNTAHEQYPWMRYAGLLSPAAIEGRVTTSSAKVSKHKDTINEVASRYNVPRELIGGIIFKEQLTKSLPDTLANIDTGFIKNARNHSTGLGAIFPATARAAWAEVDEQKELPKTDAELQYKLTYDKKFNIETIAAVLLYEAMNKEIISDVSEASNLTADQWWEAVKEYNGSGEYARKVYEYLPFTTELLD